MRTTTLRSLLLVITLGCSRTHDERPPAPMATTGNAPGAPGSLPGAIGKSVCQSDAECPGSNLCRPSDGACLPVYPDARLLEASADLKECTLTPIMFAFDSAELSPEATRWLDYDARCLKFQGMQSLVVEGHADARGDVAYNQDLSRRRADAVRASLQQRGLSSRLDIRPMGIQERTGVPQGRTERDYAWHRRVELLVK